MNDFQQGIEKAKQLGHELVDDPPAVICSMSRHTCVKCGCAVLGNNTTFYGSATDTSCIIKRD